MTDTNLNANDLANAKIPTEKENEVANLQSAYDSIAKAISALETRIKNDEKKIDKLASAIEDGSDEEAAKARTDRNALKGTVEENKTTKKNKATENTNLLKRINRLHEEILKEGKGQHAINIEGITKTKISEVERGFPYLFQFTGTDNFVDFFQVVKDKFTSNQ
jgi:predicted RNase H-like nuclease (RuvC/YqgF family)